MINIKRLIHNSIQIRNKKLTIHIDPYKVKNNEKKADYVLISHEHSDHLSLKDIKSVLKKKGKIIIPRSCVSKLNDEFEKTQVISFIRNEKLELNEFKLTIVPAYNTDKKFHVENSDWAGFVIDIDGKRIYYAGDTDLIPEMNLIDNIDLAILPVSGTYVMDAEEAANATKIIQPGLAMPCHYSEIVGTESDANLFKKKAHCDVVFNEVELDD
jgi:L-ascorbate metabolism protein UlaG (beta-lactamase superfamily)